MLSMKYYNGISEGREPSGVLTLGKKLMRSERRGRGPWTGQPAVRTVVIMKP